MSDPVLQQDRILLKIETSGNSDAVLKSYFSFFQRGTGVILAHDPWRVFIELGKKCSSQTPLLALVSCIMR